MKTCSCCKRLITADEWNALPLVGDVVTSDESGTFITEMRNCPCGSTLATETKISEGAES